MRRILVVSSALAMMAVSGCGEQQLGDLKDQAKDKATAKVREAGNKSKQFDRQQLEQAIKRANKSQPLKRVSCPPKLRLGKDFSVRASCTATTRGGQRVRIPVRYYPGVGIVPGRPKVLR